MRNCKVTDIGRDERAGKGYATIASGLHAGRTVADFVKFKNLSNSTLKHVKRRYDAFIAGRGLPENF